MYELRLGRAMSTALYCTRIRAYTVGQSRTGVYGYMVIIRPHTVFEKSLGLKDGGISTF